VGAVALLGVLLVFGGPLAGTVQAEPTAQIGLPQTSGPCTAFSIYPWAMFGPCGIGAYQPPSVYQGLGLYPYGPILGVSIGGPGAGMGPGFGAFPGSPGGTPYGGFGPSGSPGTAAQPGPGQVTIADFSFQPPELTVPVGTRVTWTNNGGRQHTVTDPGVWDSGPLNPGQSYAAMFAIPGTFDYQCTIHPEMRGRVIVTSQ
jgi:plastocyanin